MNKEKLIYKVIEQIKNDIINEDLTAIFELLKTVNNQYLLSFLPENIAKELQNYE